VLLVEFFNSTGWAFYAQVGQNKDRRMLADLWGVISHMPVFGQLWLTDPPGEEPVQNKLTANRARPIIRHHFSGTAP
jgi:hypothetical protein